MKLLGLIENTVDKMISLGANQNNIYAVIGPCITQDSYEVDAKFYKEFLSLDKKTAFILKTQKLQNIFYLIY